MGKDQLNINSEEFEELCAGYALNALEPEERAQFEEILQEASEEQLELLQHMSAAANQLAFPVEETEAPAVIKQRIMDQVIANRDKDLPSEISDSSARNGFDRDTLAIAASFALLFVTLSILFYSFNLSSEISSKEEIIVEQQARITELQNENQLKEDLLSILESREVDWVMMSGMEVNPDGYGKIIWDTKSKRALLQVSNLPAVPADKDYQLWIIKNNKPVGAGIFSVNNPQQDSFFKFEEIAIDKQTADAFAITMEPKGGVPQPTGDMYLMGNMNNN